MQERERGPVIVSVGGGKGGVGKSVVAVNLACAFAEKGIRTVLADADLGGANVHTFFGISRPEKTLRSFLAREVSSLDEALIPSGFDNLSLLCGATALLDAANPHYAKKERLLKGLKSLDTDFLVVDIGAGASLNNLDFFNASHRGLIVTAPQPTSIQNAYGFLKLALQRRVMRLVGMERLKRIFPDQSPESLKGMEFTAFLSKIEESDEEAGDLVRYDLEVLKVYLVVNMATPAEARKVYSTIDAVANRFLTVSLSFLGHIPPSRDVEVSVRKMRPVLSGGGGEVGERVREMARTLLGDLSPRRDDLTPPSRLDFFQGLPEEERKKARLVLNDDVHHNGFRIHVQTEDLGPEKAEVVTVVFSGGQVLFSRKSSYSDLGVEGGGPDEVRERALWQHRGVLAGISRGKLDDKIAR
ncbi:MAG: hypothetical protein D6713_06605 [Deltaproteobacteria bacterium]|nr:MAG: hypothetical protein D6713_06605 [Deltaproteobacteria bacterium]